MRHPIAGSAITTVLCLAVTAALTGCAPSPATPDSARSEEEVASVSENWSPDADCAACHDKENASIQNTACTAAFHGASQDFTCATCHNDEDALFQIHVSSDGKKPPKKLKKTEVSADTCLTCHGTEELAASTTDFNGLTDREGTTVNPHNLPDNEDHASEISCISCHSGHSEKPSSEQAADLCTGCHHENVYQCGTCH